MRGRGRVPQPGRGGGGVKILGGPRCCDCDLHGAKNCPPRPARLHMSETSDSGSGSFKASFVTVNKLAFERVSMAECIMGSHTSSMFGITNIFCEKISRRESRD